MIDSDLKNRKAIKYAIGVAAYYTLSVAEGIGRGPMKWARMIFCQSL